MLPFLAPLLLGGGSFLGGLFGNRNKQSSSSSSSSTNTTMPSWDPAFTGLRDLIMPITMKRLTDPQSFSKQLGERGIADINRTYDLAEQGLGNRLTARGLGSSPVAGAGEGNLAGGRAGDIVGLLRDLPLIDRQIQDQDLNMAQNFLGMGRGMTSTGTATNTGTATGSQGGGFGGGLQSMMSMLAYLYGSGAFGGGGGAQPPIPSTGFPVVPYSGGGMGGYYGNMR